MELVPKNSTQGVDDAQVNKIPNFHVDILSGYFPVQKYLVMHFWSLCKLLKRPGFICYFPVGTELYIYEITDQKEIVREIQYEHIFQHMQRCYRMC